MAESTDSFIQAELAGHTWQRRSSRPGDSHVLWHTDNWLNTLPEGVRPVHLQREFPRIANDLSELWGDPPALDRYFQDKEFSPHEGRREGRRGFPPLVKEELLALHVYALRTRPMPYESRVPQRASLLS